ncbi:hypothetical protein CLIB1423_07S05820 [[Candida] railenensis]|uniref:Rad21/Rec8-like protein N-terminal domain-containing protein n=1 Tax=[Candida] railenensis TaxID=45579 RepID=A0A9P0QPY4_9ASCO|nr:hypothetical protein CLIB1423_07S05820 [[Candida] railenensis]
MLSSHIIQMDFALLSKSSDHGVATAWLLSTLGSRSKYKKICKKDVLNSSIPSTCSIIKNSPIPLKFSSNLMYGIVLLYRQKVDYYFSDVIHAKTKIQRDLLFSGLESKGLRQTNSGIHNEVILSASSAAVNKVDIIYLTDDPLFNVDFDLIKSFQNEADEGSGSQDFNLNKLMILDRDYDHPVINTISRFDDTMVAGEEVSLDFEFDNNGLVIEKEALSEEIFEDFRQDLSVVDFDEGTEKSISDGLNTEIAEMASKSSGTFRVLSPNSEGPNLGIKKRFGVPRKRLIIDSETTIPPNEFKRFRVSIEEEEQRTFPKPFNTEDNYRSSSNLTDISKIIHQETKHSPPFIKLCYLQAFGKIEDITDAIPSEYFQRHNLSIENAEIEFSRRMAGEDVESSRRLMVEDSRRIVGEISGDNNISDIDIAYDEQSSIHDNGYEDDTFNLSFSDVRVSSNWLGDDEGTDELGSKSSELGLNREAISKFHDFLKSRSSLFGNLEKTDNGESTYKISFKTLIPTESVSRKIAAASFSSVLVLATSGSIQLQVSEDVFNISAQIRGDI